MAHALLTNYQRGTYSKNRWFHDITAMPVRQCALKLKLLSTHIFLRICSFLWNLVLYRTILNKRIIKRSIHALLKCFQIGRVGLKGLSINRHCYFIDIIFTSLYNQEVKCFFYKPAAIKTYERAIEDNVSFHLSFLFFSIRNRNL